MRSLVILGSTGSIGTNALKVISRFDDIIKIKGLTAYSNVKKLAEQIMCFTPEVVAVGNEEYAIELEKLILKKSVKPKILLGEAGYIELAGYINADIVLNAIVGAAGLLPTLAAIDAGKDIALANKESLVMAGNIIMNKVSQNNINLIPVDSEHSAIYQCMLGNRKRDIKNIFLTASGGPFLNRPKKTFCNIRLREALNHPNWSMGKKISIDSATFMNKSLEIIEASYLFDISVDQIKVLVHPESIIHSMVSYQDSSIIAQMSIPDMRGAIAYAVLFPHRFDLGLKEINFPFLGNLSFFEPDIIKFPCLELGFRVCRMGGAIPAVMNASNEVAVQSFLNKKINFTDIYEVVNKCIDDFKFENTSSIANIISSDKWARINTIDIINNLANNLNQEK